MKLTPENDDYGMANTLNIPRSSCAELGPPVYSTEHHPIWDVGCDGSTAVIICHFNPCGYARPRYNLNVTLTGLLRYSVPVFAAELTFEDSPSYLPHHPRVRHLRGKQDKARLFQKEALWNVAEKLVPEHVVNLVFLDADIVFSSPTWVKDVESALTSHKVALPYSHAVWQKASGEPLFSKPSSAYALERLSGNMAYSVAASHPGFGIAIRRRAFREIGGFRGCPVAGGGDVLFVHAAMGDWSRSGKNKYASPEWPRTVERVIGGSITSVPGEARHFWHGDFSNRRYDERHRWLAEFNESVDIDYSAGFAQWSASALATKSELVARVSRYYSERLEDGA